MVRLLENGKNSIFIDRSPRLEDPAEMPFPVMLTAFLMAAQSEGEQVRVVGRPWAPFISPMGEPFRANSVNEDPFARWFQQADRNRDAKLTVDELQADAERFFKTLDLDQNGAIDPEEITVYESEVAQEVQVNTRWKRSPEALAQSKSETRADKRKQWRANEYVDGYQLHGLQGAARYGLLNIPEPVAGADADFNRSTSFAEFQGAAAHRFQLLDEKKLGFLTLAELETLLPTRPKGGKAVRLLKEPRDTRVGLPLPKGD